jgi:hypothetical protein
VAFTTPVPVPTSVDYRTRVDSFNVIRRRGDDSFVVLEKDGTVLEYGRTLATRSYIPGRGTYAWHLSSIRDSFGNTIELAYALGDPEAGESRQLTSVRYTIRGSEAVGPEANVSFHWELRNDVRRSSIHGGEVVLSRRLDRIETHSGPQLVRSFDLCYADEECSGVVDAPPARPWLLMSVTESGSDGTACLPEGSAEARAELDS